MTGEEWGKILLAVGLLAGMFVFPIVMLWRDERRKRRSETQPLEDAFPRE